MTCIDKLNPEEALSNMEQSCISYGIQFVQQDSGWFATHVYAGSLGPYKSRKAAISKAHVAWVIGYRWIGYRWEKEMKQTKAERIAELENAFQRTHSMLSALHTLMCFARHDINSIKVLEVFLPYMEEAEGTISRFEDLESSISACYFIVDDVINERGREGYIVMFGNPYEAIGHEQIRTVTLREAKAYVKQKDSAHTVYRVHLARRHGEGKVTKIKL